MFVLLTVCFFEYVICLFVMLKTNICVENNSLVCLIVVCFCAMDCFCPFDVCVLLACLFDWFVACLLHCLFVLWQGH